MSVEGFKIHAVFRRASWPKTWERPDKYVARSVDNGDSDCRGVASLASKIHHVFLT
jgi:hypothetical protein